MSVANSGFIETRHSSVHSQHSPIPQYHTFPDAAVHQGLGINVSSGIPYVPSGNMVFEPAGPAPPTPFYDQTPFARGTQSPDENYRRPTDKSHYRRAAPVNIAPDPAGARQLEEARARQASQRAQRERNSRRRARRHESPTREEENVYLWQLRAQKRLPWKEITDVMHQKTGKRETISCLQMRLSRSKRRWQQWSEDDVSMCVRAPL